MMKKFCEKYLTRLINLIGIFSLILISYFFAHGVVLIENNLIYMTRQLKLTALDYYASSEGLTLSDLKQPIFNPEENLKIFEIAEIEAKKRDLAPQIIKSIIKIESTKNQFALSPKGAIGAMQVMPEHLAFCGLPTPNALFELNNNIKCGTAIFEDALQSTHGDVYKALQIYNGGPKCLNKCKDSIKYAQDVINTSAKWID